MWTILRLLNDCDYALVVASLTVTGRLQSRAAKNVPGNDQLNPLTAQ